MKTGKQTNHDAQCFASSLIKHEQLPPCKILTFQTASHLRFYL